MKMSKIVLLAAVLTAAPLGASAANAQNQRPADQHRDANADQHRDANADRHRDANADRSRGDRRMDRDRMNDRHDWHGDRGHHYGWHRGRGNWHRHCRWVWHHHHHVRICRR